MDSFERRERGFAAVENNNFGEAVVCFNNKGPVRKPKKKEEDEKRGRGRDNNVPTRGSAEERTKRYERMLASKNPGSHVSDVFEREPF